MDQKWNSNHKDKIISRSSRLKLSPYFAFVFRIHWRPSGTIVNCSKILVITDDGQNSEMTQHKYSKTTWADFKTTKSDQDFNYLLKLNCQKLEMGKN